MLRNAPLALSFVFLFGPFADVGETQGEPGLSPFIGGIGGVYFLAERGELIVEIHKRDLHALDRRTDLRAVLFSPDRTPLAEVTIPDDGGEKGSGPGEPQGAWLKAYVPRTGVYGLNVTVGQDAYGQEIAWAFRSNCPKYLIETSRGHKDERHEEPIVLRDPTRPVDVCFQPRTGEFSVEVSGLPKSVSEVTVLDAAGAAVQTLAAKDGKASASFPKDSERGVAPWRLHLPKGQATIQIDGLTRWAKRERFENLCLWTPDPESWFPFAEHRWLLTPYSQRRYGAPGETGAVTFTVANSSSHEERVDLDLEFPAAEWPVQLDSANVAVPARSTTKVTLTYTAPPLGEEWACCLRATPAGDPAFSTYSTLTVVGGQAPAAVALRMPIYITPYRHENEQFGYAPDYPTECQLYFDPENRPVARASSSRVSWRDGAAWASASLGDSVTWRDAALGDEPLALSSTKVAFGGDGGMYLVANAGKRAAVLRSGDGGLTWSAHRLPKGKGEGLVVDIEQFSGHNLPDGPPPLVRYTRTADDPNLKWRHVNDMELYLPEWQDGKLSFPEPILITRECLGHTSHSGMPSSVVSRGSKVHVIWAEVTDPATKPPGAPTYAATYDRETRTLSKPALVGYGAPANDGHNSPSITIDSQGYLHTLTGTHGHPFQYARSLRPNDSSSGWTKPEPVGKDLLQTYVGLVCGPDDTLHLVSRIWRNGAEPYPRESLSALAYLRKRPNGPWEPPVYLVVPAFSGYSVYYHRLTIDRRGRLFLSYDYWTTYWFYRNDHRGNRRAVLMSPDGGDAWKLAGAEDML